MDAIVRGVSRFATAVKEAIVHTVTHQGSAQPPLHDEDDEPHEGFAASAPVNYPPATCTVGVLRGAFQGHVQNMIAQHGGRPVVLDPRAGSPQELMEKVDALAICGGRDVDPKFYNEPNERSHGISPGGTQEDAFMIACIQEGYKRGTPMLGMCRGHQLMNVADGGSLYQDFPSQQLQGKSQHGSDGHVVTFDPDSQIAHLIGTTRWATNTIHHQAVKAVGPNLRVTGHTPDGVVEAIERKNNPTQIGTQFHPEVMQDAGSHILFQYLVDSGTHFRSEHNTIAA